MKKTGLIRTLFAAFGLTIMLAFVACNKEKDTTATITVVDVDGVAVVGAEVHIFPAPSVDTVSEDATIEGLDLMATSDSKGKAKFNFTDYYEQGQAGFAVLNIEVNLDARYGDGIIKIEEEEDNEETVTILP